MKFLESILVVNQALRSFAEKWGDNEDGWVLGARTKYMVLGHLYDDLRAALSEGRESDVPTILSTLSAASIFWLMSDYEYLSDNIPTDDSISKAGYL